MQEATKSLEQLRKEAKKLKHGVRKWASLAGLPYQIVYRRLANPETVRLVEYQQLSQAVERMKSRHAPK